MHWRRKWQPTPVFLPGESQGRGTWWAAVYEVAQSRTRLKRLSSSSSSVGSSAVTNGPLGVGGKLITVEVIICGGRGHMGGFPGSSAGKESTCNAGDPWVRSLGRSLEEGMAIHSSILA